MQSRTRIGSGAITLAGVLAALGGCAGEGGPLIEHRESLADAHELGVTACPQALGTIEVELSPAAREGATIAIAEDIPSIDVLDPDRGWPILPGYTTAMLPGETIALDVEFNCFATSDVRGTITIDALDRGGVPMESASIPIELHVTGAP